MRKLAPFLLAVIIVLSAGCNGIIDNNQNVINDTNQDQVWHMPSDTTLGNIELWFIPGTLQGNAIWLVNGPARAVGFDLTDARNRGTFYFGDGYTSAGGNRPETGTTIPYNQWLYARVVVYRTISGTVAAFLDALGWNFFDHLEDSWVEDVFEAQIFISHDGGLQFSDWQRTTQLYTFLPVGTNHLSVH